jgi:hypothetical protein
MGEWNRSTTILALEKIQPELRKAIQRHIEANDLGSILDDYLICIETISNKKKKKLYGDDHG